MPEEHIQPQLHEGVISVITPCYNVGNYITRFLNSLIAQTYSDLEIILINDGSTDNTLEIISSFVPALEESNYTVKIINQSNRGLAGAIDTGLKHFTGEFVTWPDPDDWLPADSFERRIEIMRQHPEVGLLRTPARNYLEDTCQFSDYTEEPDEMERFLTGIFDNIFNNRILLHPICHFARSRSLIASIGRSIHVSPKGSQNIQILLPLTQHFPVLWSGNVCGFYAIRKDSRSRQATTAEALLARQKMMHENTKETLSKLKGDKIELQKHADLLYVRNRMLLIAFEGCLFSECKNLVRKAKLAWWRRCFVEIMIVTRKTFPFRFKLSRPGAPANLLSKAFFKLIYFRAPYLFANWEDVKSSSQSR